MAGVGVVASCVSIPDVAAVLIGAQWKDARRRPDRYQRPGGAVTRASLLWQEGHQTLNRRCPTGHARRPQVCTIRGTETSVVESSANSNISRTTVSISSFVARRSVSRALAMFSMVTG